MDDSISSEDEFVDQMVQSVMREDAYAMGRAAGYRGRRLGRAMDNIEKWKDIGERKRAIEVYLKALEADLPDNPADWNDEHKVIGAQLALIRASDKSDVMQRGLEHIAKIKGLTATRGGERDDDTKEKKVLEDLAKLSVQMKDQLEAKARE